MLLATLKSKLQTVTGTSIGEVFFDWKKYLNITRTKTYPIVLWSLDNAKFKNDARITTQKQKEYTITVFAIALFDPNTQDKITVWDTLEGYFYTYLNKMNTDDQVIQIMNINDLRGEYVPEGMISADSEIGIMFTDVVIRTYC